MLRRLVILMAVMLGLCAVPAAAMATSIPYPPTGPGLTVSPATVAVGDTVTIHGSGFNGLVDPVACEIDTPDGPEFIQDCLDNWGDMVITFTVQSSGLRAPGAAFAALATPSQSVTLDTDGTFTTTAVMDTEGTILITAIAVYAGGQASAIVVVTAPASTTGSAASTTPASGAGGGGSTSAAGGGGNGGSGGLPNTGVNRTVLVIGVTGGALAIIIGGGLVWLAATRRPRRHAA